MGPRQSLARVVALSGLVGTIGALVARAQPVFIDQLDGGFLLLRTDGGELRGPDGGPWVVPHAQSTCGLDAGPLLTALRSASCRDDVDCEVRQLDIDHAGLPKCLAAPRRTWTSRAVAGMLDELADACGLATKYPRTSCPQASCVDRRCDLDGQLGPAP